MALSFRGYQSWKGDDDQDDDLLGLDDVSVESAPKPTMSIERFKSWQSGTDDFGGDDFFGEDLTPSQKAREEQKTFGDTTPEEVKEEVEKTGFLKRLTGSLFGTINKAVSKSQEFLQEKGFIATPRAQLIEEEREEQAREDLQMTQTYAIDEDAVSIGSEMLKQNAKTQISFLNERKQELENLNVDNATYLAQKKRELGEAYDARQVLSEKKTRIAELATELGYFGKEGLSAEDLKDYTLTGSQISGLIKQIDDQIIQANRNITLNDELTKQKPTDKNVWNEVKKTIQNKNYLPSLLKGTKFEANEDFYSANKAIKEGATFDELTADQRSALIAGTNEVWEGLIDRGFVAELPEMLSQSVGLGFDMAISRLLTGGNPFIASAVDVALTGAGKTAQRIREVTEDQYAFVPTEDEEGNVSFRIMQTSQGTEDDIKGTASAIVGQYTSDMVEMLLGDKLDDLVDVGGKFVKDSKLGQSILKSDMAQKLGESFVAKSIDKASEFLKNNQTSRQLLKLSGISSLKGEVAEELVQDITDSVTTGQEYEISEDYLKEIVAQTAVTTFILSSGARASDILNDREIQKFVDEVNTNKEDFGIPENAEITFDGRVVNTTTNEDITDDLMAGEIEPTQEVAEEVTTDIQVIEDKIGEAIESKLAVDDLTEKELNNLGNMFIELQESVSQPQRGVSAVTDEITGETTFAKTGVGYPSWMPQEYRNKQIVEEVLTAITEENVPKSGTKAYNLYQMLLQNSREGEDFLGYTTARREGERRYDEITSMDDIRRNLDILRKDAQKARDIEDDKRFEEAKGWLLLSDEQEAELNEYDKADYDKHIKPKIEAVAKRGVGDDEVMIVRSGTGRWVDTDVAVALNRGVNKDTVVEVVKESDLESTGVEAKDERGERLLADDLEVLRQKAETKKAPERKYERKYDLNKESDVESLTRRFDEETVENWKQGIFEWGRYKTKEELEKAIRADLIEVKEEVIDEDIIEKKIKNSVVKEIAYHGTNADFEKFSYEFLGTTGTVEGYGFYFTDKKDVARQYMEDDTGRLITAYLNIEKPLSTEEVTITEDGLKRLIKKLDPTGENILANYGDYRLRGYNEVLQESVDNLMEYNENDVDIVHDLMNATGKDPEKFYSVLTKELGYDGIIVDDADTETGEKFKVYVIFSNDQIFDIKKGADEKEFAKGRVNLEDYVDRGKKVETSELRIAEKVTELTRKYAKRIGEKYVPRGSLGAYYKLTKDIRLKGITDFYVASHEIAHAIDHKNNISLSIPSGAVVGELEQAYLDMYPNARTGHDQKLKVQEGFATLIAEYVKSPLTMAEKYPHAVKELLLDGGEYYKEVIGDYINDLENIVVEYQSLSDLDKIGTRLVKEIPVAPNFMYKNKLEEQLTIHYDKMRMLERVVKERGDFMTNEDFVQFFRSMDYVSAIVDNNFSTEVGDKVLKGDSRIAKFGEGLLNYVAGDVTDEYWRYNPATGNIDKQLDYNWGTLRRRVALKGLSDEFNYSLVARRVYYDFQNKKEYERQLEINKERLTVIEEQLIELDQQENGEVTDEVRDLRNEKIALEMESDEVQEKLNYTNRVIENDGWTEDLVTRAYIGSRDLFISEFEMFDELTNQDLLLAVDSGDLSKDKYNELKQNKGYASFKRLVVDEIVGEIDPTQMEGARKLSSGQISALKKRTGSTKQIFYPVDSAMRNHQEFANKAMKQIALNMFLTNETVSTLNEMIKPVEYYKGLEFKDDILITKENGEKKAYAVDPMIKRMAGELLPRQANNLQKLVHQHKKLVTQGITGSYMQFALTNLPRDFFTYVTQTYQKNSMKAVYNLFYDTARVIGGKLNNSEEYEYFNKFLALGGQELTFVKWMDGGYDAFDKHVTNELSGLEKLKRAVGKIVKTGIDIVSLPSHVSELVFRATEFIEAKKAGDADFVALEKARRVTAPFHLKGLYMSKDKEGKARTTVLQGAEELVDTYSPFVKAGKNAFLWSAINFVENKKIRQRMIVTTAMITALGIEELLRAWNSADDDQKEQFRDLTAEDWGRFIHMPSKKSNSITRLAVPEWAGGVSGFINMLIMDTMIDAEDTNFRLTDYTTALTTSVPDQWNMVVPMSALFSEDGFKEFSRQVGKNVLGTVPAIAQPIISIAGYKTYPELAPIESAWQQGKLPADRFNEGTSKFAKWVLQQELPFSRERLGDSLGLSPLKLDALLNSFFGRSIGYITQKPNAWNMTSSVVRDYYFEYGRRVSEYSKSQENIDQEYTAIKNGTGNFTKDEQIQIYTKYQLGKDIDKALKAYSEAYDTKDLDLISNTRSTVIDLIDQYNNGGMSEELRAYQEDPSAENMKEFMAMRIRNEVADKPFSQYDEVEVKEAKDIMKDFRKEALLVRSEYDYDQLLIGLTKNADKSAKVGEVKEEITDPEDFRKYLAGLRYANLISDDCIKLMYKDGVLDADTAKWAIKLPKNVNF